MPNSHEDSSEYENSSYPYAFPSEMIDESGQVMLPVHAYAPPMYSAYQPSWEEYSQSMYHPMAASQAPENYLYYHHPFQGPNGPAYYISPAAYSQQPNFITPHLNRRPVQPEPYGYSPKLFEADSEASIAHAQMYQLQQQMHNAEMHRQHVAPAAGPIAEYSSTPAQTRKQGTNQRGTSSLPNNRVGVYEAVYSNIPVFEIICNGVAVMRRQRDSFINATHILKVAGIEKGKRTKILEREIHSGIHEKVQGGYGKYQGTWIPMERAQELARSYNVEVPLQELLYMAPNRNETFA